ncbi:semaphorin-4D isoform X1 [Mobula birostris]|uniref:semaphorin-4D isoform X1 n=1 Tax=Mobula birostris TaxID=1983395 RepID=UPI003B2883DD
MKRRNMALVALYVTLHLVRLSYCSLAVPRTVWKYGEVPLITFSATGVSNYSTLLLNEDRGVLYVGAQEAIFAVNMLDVSDKRHEVFWKVSDEKQRNCAAKGKSKETECLNYIRILHEFDDETLYVCGTFAFQPTCDYLSIKNFTLQQRNEEGKGKCPFDPAQKYTSVMVDQELYSGTVYNFLGSETVILRGHLRTEYAIPWLNEPSFVYSDVLRKSKTNLDSDDDKIYFFFTEVSIEYEFFSRILVPRIARVCKGDQGGSRILQKRWTSFLKARLDCSLPESHFVFNIIQDAFVLKTSHWNETVFYGVFTSQWSNLEMSAVCSFNMSKVEDIFSTGKFMQSATFDQSHVKWVRFGGSIPLPRPGSCINNEARALNFSNTLMLPDRTLQFVKDHPLMADAVTPIGNAPKLVKKNVNYIQIVVDRVRALDNQLYDVMFLGTDKGLLHKAVNFDNKMHIIEEVRIFPVSEPVQTLVLSKQDRRYIYAGSHSGVVQVPVASCEKYKTCTDCILARDPYCAWNPQSKRCTSIMKSNNHNDLLQFLNGNATLCRTKDVEPVWSEERVVEKGGLTELTCLPASRLAKVTWKLNNRPINKSSKYRVDQNNLLILHLTEADSGVYDCWTMEAVMGDDYEQLVKRYSLIIGGPSNVITAAPTTPLTQTEGKSATPLTSTDKERRSPHTVIIRSQTEVSTSTVFQSSAGTSSTPMLMPITNNDIKIETNIVRRVAESEGTNSILLFFFVVIVLLFLMLVTYNCYMRYLPGPCLKLCLYKVGNGKKPKFDYDNVSEELVKQPAVKINGDNQGSEQIATGDKGYETESDCGNGKISNTEKPQELKQIQENCSIKSVDPEKDADIKYIDEEAQSLC